MSTSKNDVTCQHEDYVSAKPAWERTLDAAAGEMAVKAKGESYLPRPNPIDRSDANRRRYDHYLMRAVYYNVTGRTLLALIGIAFKRWPEIKLPAELEYLTENANGAGLSMMQHAQACLSHVLCTGRSGVLADYPALEQSPATRQDQTDGTVRATMTLYPASAITNWRTKQIAGKVVLSMVVLHETYDVIDAFATTKKPQYRVLKLDESDQYVVEIWRKNATAERGEEWQLTSTSFPRQSNQQKWTEIPFTFVGAKNNDWAVDDAPLFDIATLNLAHYRNSADHEDSVYFCGQPQFFMSGLTEEWRDKLIEEGVYVGSRTILPLPVGGTAGVLQAEPNTLAAAAMKDKESQMAALGARLLITEDSVKTATQIDSEDSTSHSVLSLACDNLSNAYERALNWCALFDGAEAAIEFQMPNDFRAGVLDATLLSTLLAAVQAGKMPESDFWTQLRNAGFIDSTKTDDQIREEIASQEPTPAKVLGEDQQGEPPAKKPADDTAGVAGSE